MSYQGDIAEDATIDFKFTTVDVLGAPTTLAGTPALSVYKANGTTQSTAGITLTVDFDSVTGLHNARIDTSADAFYATGNDYQVVITTGTVDGDSVVGYVVGEFSIENRNTKADLRQIAGNTTNATNLGTAASNYSATRGLAGTALPAAAADAAGGLVISDAGGLDIDAKLANTNEVTAARMGALTDWLNGGRLDLLVDDIIEKIGAPALGSVSADIIALLTRLTTTRAGYLDNLNGHTAQTGDSYARIGANGAGLTNIVLPSGGLANVTAWTVAITGNLTGNVSGSVGSVTGGINTAAGTLTTLDGLDTAQDSQHGTTRTLIGTAAGADIAADIAAVKTDTGNLVTRITSTLFTGITSMAEWLGLLAGKQTGDSTARTELRATGAGSGTFDETTDSQEALRDRGDAAWLTATGFSTHSAADVWTSGTRTLTAFTFAVDVASDGMDNVTLPANIITGVSVAASAFDGKGDWNTTTPPTAAAMADAVWDEARAGHTGSGTFGEHTGDAAMRGTDSANTTTPLSAAQVNAEVDTAIETYHLDHLLAAAYDPTSKPGNASGLLNVIFESDGGVPRYTANALEQGPSGGGGSADWTDGEKEQIRYRLQLDGDQTEPTDTDLPEVNVKQVNGTAVAAGALSVTVNSAVATDGTITLYAGASYSSNTSQLGLTLSNYTGPDPTGATFVFRATTTEAYDAGDSSNVLGSITTTAALSGSDLPLLFDLTKTQSALLADENPPKKPWNYQYVCLWTKDGEEYVIAEGAITAKQIIGAGS